MPSTSTRLRSDAQQSIDRSRWLVTSSRCTVMSSRSTVASSRSMLGVAAAGWSYQTSSAQAADLFSDVLEDLNRDVPVCHRVLPARVAKSSLAGCEFHASDGACDSAQTVRLGGPPDGRAGTSDRTPREVTRTADARDPRVASAARIQRSYSASSAGAAGLARISQVTLSPCWAV